MISTITFFKGYQNRTPAAKLITPGSLISQLYASPSSQRLSQQSIASWLEEEKQADFLKHTWLEEEKQADFLKHTTNIDSF